MSVPRLALTLALMLAAARSEAAVVDATVTTLLGGRSDPRDGALYTVVPLYEGLHLSVHELSLRHVDEVRIEMNGWIGGWLGQPAEGQRFTGDLDVLTIEARLARRHVLVRLGRQLVVGGVARFSHLDGASVTLEGRGLGLTMFGGVPVIPRFDVKAGDATGGARLFYRFSYESQLAVSFIHIEDTGRTGRQDLGLDFRTRPIRALTLTGLGVFSLVERDFAELDLAATLEPHRAVTLRVDFRRQRPDLFIPRSSIFSVFSNSNRQEAGGFVDYRPHERADLSADYHVIADETGVGHRAGLKGQLRLGPHGELRVGTEVRVLRLPDKGYEEARAFVAFRILPTLLATIDGDLYFFSAPVNGRDHSYTGAASVAWDFRPGWRLVASGAGSSTPFVNGGWDAMVRLAYNATLRGKARR
jgi:hypothetical protein